MASGSEALLVASASPRRRDLLLRLGLSLEVVAPGVSEATIDGESPADYVKRVARHKGDAVRERFPGRVLLAADTAVVLDGAILGKPSSPETAEEMLRRLSGREHCVLTAVVVSGPMGQLETTVSTRVRFREISAREIAWYVATGEPMDKAGAYAIQDRGGMFVATIEGSATNVVGLPLGESLALLSQSGFRLPWEVDP
jgi:septum formation protein